MIPIYICDDEEAARVTIQRELEKEILIEGYDMQVVCAAGNPEELLNSLEEPAKRGIYFLDVELKGCEMNGFTLGQEIRKRDARGFLIYVTAFRELAFETFRYHLEALDYIVKENTEWMFQGIRKNLGVVSERIRQEQGEQRRYFSIKMMDVVRHIPVDEIVFFETTDKTHRILLHGLNGRMDFVGSMQDLERRLGKEFLRVHRAYLINTSQIESVDMKKRKIMMKNGEFCWFSKRLRDTLLSAL